MSFQLPWQAMRERAMHEEAIRQNTPRHAMSYSMIDSKGAGELVFDKCLEFDVTFVHEPTVAHGWALNGNELVPGHFPRVSAGVYRWRRNRRNYYTGCWVFVTVDIPGWTSPAEAEARHRLARDQQAWLRKYEGTETVHYAQAQFELEQAKRVLEMTANSFDINHYFTFTGTAIKDLPDHLVDL